MSRLIQTLLIACLLSACDSAEEAAPINDAADNALPELDEGFADDALADDALADDALADDALADDALIDEGIADEGIADEGIADEGIADDALADEADLGVIDPTACNGHAALCERPFDAVAYLTTHNAMANLEADFRPPNHEEGIPRQLADGARGLMLDTYEEDGALWLCHGFCVLGKTPLVEGLRQLTDFLDAHPREILTIILEAYISPEQTQFAFADADLERYAYAHPLGAPWPTLEEMISLDQRLVVFTNAPGGPDWHHDVWDYAWETPFSVETIEEFDCRLNRGDPQNDLFILNHFMTAPVALYSLAEQANPMLMERALRCQEETGRLPNFVTVDFYSLGDTLAVVDALNGI